MKRPVQRQSRCSERLGEPPLRDAAQQFHLRQPQMGVHQAEGDRKVAVAPRVDEQDEMIVPAYLDRRRERRAGDRQRGKPLGDTAGAQPVPDSGASQAQAQQHRTETEAGARYASLPHAAPVTDTSTREAVAARFDLPANARAASHLDNLEAARIPGSWGCSRMAGEGEHKPAADSAAVADMPVADMPEAEVS